MIQGTSILTVDPISNVQVSHFLPAFIAKADFSTFENYPYETALNEPSEPFDFFWALDAAAKFGTEAFKKDNLTPDETRELIINNCNIGRLQRSYEIINRGQNLTIPQLELANGEILAAQNSSKMRSGFLWVDGYGPHRARLVPPPSSALPSLMHDLCEFTTRQDIPIQLKQLVAYVQFLSIHPFSNGNGRLANLLAIRIFENRPTFNPSLESLIFCSCHRFYEKVNLNMLSSIQLGNDISARRNYIFYWIDAMRLARKLSRVMRIEFQSLFQDFKSSTGNFSQAAITFNALVKSPKFLSADNELPNVATLSSKRIRSLIDSGWLTKKERLYISYPIIDFRSRFLQSLYANWKSGRLAWPAPPESPLSQSI